MQRTFSFNFLFFAASMLLMISCSVNKQIGKLAKLDILSDSNFAPAHVGISLYDASKKKYVYNYQGDKYFIPASNTKLLTCYAAMKYLGDSLVGLRYEYGKDSSLSFQATADPTFLHPDFKDQPIYDFLKNYPFKTYVSRPRGKERPLGFGWAWDDYSSDYMAERSEFPIYGNVIRFRLNNDTIAVSPNFMYSHDYGYIQSENNSKTKILLDKNFSVRREIESNKFFISLSNSKFSATDIPFRTSIPPANFLNGKTPAPEMQYALLNDTLKGKVDFSHWMADAYRYRNFIHSQPTDSLLKITMHRSDNFFAEQTLLMVSNERLGLMSDAKIIDTLLKTDYKDLPQKPKWVDGSGLSRYNLISPQDFVAVLEKIKNEFGWNRISTILSTGNDGTLSGYYKNYAGKIYAKTGTLSNNVALSGYIITNKGKQYIFSVLVNNHQASATAIRRAVEKFLTSVMDKY